MVQRYVVTAAAWLEIVVGFVFLIVPDVPCVPLTRSLRAWACHLGAGSGLASSLCALPVCLRRPRNRTAVLYWGLLSLTRGVDYPIRVSGRRHHTTRLPAVAHRHPACHYRGGLAAASCDQRFRTFACRKRPVASGTLQLGTQWAYLTSSRTG